MEFMEIKIGLTLKSLMKQKGITLKALGAATGVSISTISEWTRNRPPKNPVQAKSVAEYLGVSLHYLLFGVSDTKEQVNLNEIIKNDLFSGIFEINLKRIKMPE